MADHLFGPTGIATPSLCVCCPAARRKRVGLRRGSPRHRSASVAQRQGGNGPDCPEARRGVAEIFRLPCIEVRTNSRPRPAKTEVRNRWIRRLNATSPIRGSSPDQRAPRPRPTPESPSEMTIQSEGCRRVFCTRRHLTQFGRTEFGLLDRSCKTALGGKLLPVESARPGSVSTTRAGSRAEQRYGMVSICASAVAQPCFGSLEVAEFTCSRNSDASTGSCTGPSAPPANPTKG